MKKPSYYYHNGFRMPMGFPIEGFTSALNYQAQPSDIFIVTYPKCGTTWTQYIVWLIQHNGEPLSASKKIEDDIPHLEEVGKEKIEILPQPRVIKTHFPYNLTPYHPQAKYIYIARNPFDCAVSFYHHTRGFIKHYNFAEGSFEDFFECFIKGEVDFGDYFDHLVPWYKHKDEHNVLFLTYENMKIEPKNAIIDIINFLGKAYKDRIKNEEILNKIIINSSLENMKKDQQRWSSKRPENMPPFIRKGQVGDWENYFSPEQQQRLIEKFMIRTAGTGLETLWNGIIIRS
ncbi:sulfotransferase domain-containing protein [Crocosphaera sp. UHCC 0190]|uniref:sulfotransferase domain-containing protein n=1 Tax=Crocosphaera sp. UHCC 0190 TaxID=3110246 RepID=UPI002B1FA8A9|nr:sulfotransferase domain-containing protein [Crocosphaera sp. UHCC 0190]MEA5511736.1 sulfotransferase domain-containing protein [Crocosphaera sp. UHCC 0190]